MSLYVFMPGMNAESSKQYNKRRQALEPAVLCSNSSFPHHISQQQGNKAQMTNCQYALLWPVADPTMAACSQAFPTK